MIELNDSAALDALCAKSGSRRVSFGYEILDPGGAPKLSPETISGWIGVDAARAVSRHGRFVIKDDTRIDYARDILRVTFRLVVDGFMREWPLGSFFMPKAKRVGRSCAFYREIAAQDLCAALAFDEFSARFRIPAATPYTDAVRALIAASSFGEPLIERSAAALPYPLEFDIGESKLSAISKLLAAISYEPLFADACGRFVARGSALPALRGASFVYSGGQNCVITGPAAESQDVFALPNVFHAVASRSDSAMTYTARIDDPAHPLSPARRDGRAVVRTIALPECASFDALVLAAESAKALALAAAAKVEFETLTMPHHETRDVFYLATSDLPCRKYIETAWEMELAPAAKMLHVCGRV